MAESSEKFRPVASKDFQYKRIQYHLEESTYLGPGKVTELEWKDYCPEIFRHIQQHDKINHADYTMLLCAKDILKEVSSPGKPGRVIILPTNNKFVIKTLRKSEMKVILNTLQKYHRHLMRNQSTLLLRLYGLHSVKQFGGLKVYFIVFGNPILLDMNIYCVYHLKGSSRGRKVQKMRVDEYTIHKDSDFDYCFYLNPLVREKLLEQIKIDCDYLEEEGIMEYSLLIGLAMQTSYTGTIDSRSLYSKNTDSTTSSSPTASIDSETISSHSSQEFEDTQLSFADACQEPDSNIYKFGRGLPARAVRANTTEVGEQEPESFNVMLYFGIVDFYQKFNVAKRIEHIYKSIQYDSKSISAVKPQEYSSRFRYFLEQTFLAEDSVDFGICNWYVRPLFSIFHITNYYAFLFLP
ncbi:putative phosphatidylinositol 4-phosphate 5-kinase 11 isoform X1 [Ricinus communis]|uniref:putative phosphatidylinositol 4-phosphate 5-kinase 11 isoform X1 n=1 Tax=Ricinus communis TaxID=3988 RepID=UPI00201ACD26|nr:putative phosphatidylinositol 4-phosphate 5-kinase 11 isoform X1 [Ricinus communis]